jgi:H+-transporting ATPase
VYSGSIIKRGELDALVYGTGRNTYFGKTAGLVETARTVSHFQRAVLKIGDYLILVALVMVVLILGVALERGDPMLRTLEFVLILTVAAIPVAMPTVLSVTMAVGARILAKAQAIVSRLVSIEELAGMDILCSDKTGTLTQNRLTLGAPFALEGVSAEEVVRCAALASRAEDQDPIDLAVLSGAGAGAQDGRIKVIHFQPFDPVGKRTEATVADGRGGTFKVSKGAPQVILALLGEASAVSAPVRNAVEEFAARGFRSLGVARTDTSGAWRYLGVLPLFDPPRVDSKQTIETARQLGVAVKMVTARWASARGSSMPRCWSRRSSIRARRSSRPSRMPTASLRSSRSTNTTSSMCCSGAGTSSA